MYFFLIFYYNITKFEHSFLNYFYKFNVNEFYHTGNDSLKSVHCQFNFQLIFKVYSILIEKWNSTKENLLREWRAACVARMSLEERLGVGLERKGISRVETYVWIRGKAKRFILRGDSDLSAPSSPHPDPPPPHPSRRNLDLQIHPGHDYFASLLSSFFKNPNTRVIWTDSSKMACSDRDFSLLDFLSIRIFDSNHEFLLILITYLPDGIPR